MSKQLHPFLENLLKIISWIPGFKSFTTLLDPPSLEFWFVIPAEIHIQVKERPPTTLKDDRNHFRPMKNPKKSSQWNLFQKPLAPSQCTNTTHFTKGEKKKPSTSTSYSVPSSVICHFDSCPGEQRSKLPTPSLLSHKCSGWEEKKTKDRALGHPNTHQDLQGRKRKKNQRIWYTPNSGSLGQTNTQWAIKSPCTKKGAFQVP